MDAGKISDMKDAIERLRSSTVNIHGPVVGGGGGHWLPTGSIQLKADADRAVPLSPLGTIALLRHKLLGGGCLQDDCGTHALAR